MEKKYKLLSYPLNVNTPVYGDGFPFQIKQEKQIDRKDRCNTATVSFLNHTGTHIDAPKHFDNKGKSIGEYGIEEFIFNFPYVLDYLAESNKLIMPDILEKNKDYLKKCDLLLIRTGFSRYREKKKYKFSNPVISPDAARLIRSDYGNIRSIGVDTISVSSCQHRKLGAQTHKIFFCKEGYKSLPILLIEDMNL
ncbi:cyclase family protein, partial [bacterium]|nr:cyclase family protein [bacterium]